MWFYFYYFLEKEEGEERFYKEMGIFVCGFIFTIS